MVLGGGCPLPSNLVDQNGRPYPEEPPTKVTAEAETTGAREQVYQPVTRGITPARMAHILDSAAEGEYQDFLTMAEEMEEKDLHYFSMLSTRKNAIKGCARSLEPFDESERAKQIAADCERYVVKTPAFSGMLFDLLDALAKGYACVQPVWDTTTRPWTYKEFYYTDPRWFVPSDTDQTVFLLKSETKPDGEPLPPGKFVFHFPKVKSGIPIRGGLARICALAFMFKTYTMKDWLAFMEVFGMPTRIGKYDPATATNREKATLLNALRGLGHDAAAMIPEGMDIELLDAKRPSGSDSLFGGLAEYLDKQVSKAVLGQTMTSDDGASLSQALVHQMVRQDIMEADAEQLEATVNEYIIKPWVVYNYGENAPLPSLKITTDPPEDLKNFTEAALPWVKAGVAVEAAWIRDKFGIPEPPEDAEDLVGETQEEDPAQAGDPPVPPNQEGNNAPEDGGEVATNAALPPSLVPAETTADSLARNWVQTMGPYEDVIQEMANNSSSYEEFLAKVEDAQKKFDSNQFVRRLAVEMAKVRGIANA